MSDHHAASRLGLLITLVVGLLLGGCAVREQMRSGDAALARNDPLAAARHYEAALGLKPKLAQDDDFVEKLRVARRDAALEQGRSFIDQQRWDTAIERLQASLRQEPGYAPAAAALEQARGGAAEAAFTRAISAADAGDEPAAQAALTEALRHRPKHEQATAAQASLGDPRRGAPGAVDAYSRGQSLVAEHRWPQAEESLRAAIVADAEYLPARLALANVKATRARVAQLLATGRAAREERRLESAIESLASAAAIAPHDAAVAEALAQARATFAEAERLADAASAALTAGAWDDAIAEADGALRIYPQSRAAATRDAANDRAAAEHTGQGQSLLRSNDLDAAAAAFIRARQYRPEHPPAIAGLSAVATARGDEAAADGRWGASLLHHLEADRLASTSATQQDVASARQRVVDRVAVRLIVPETAGSRVGDAMELQRTMLSRLAARAPDVVSIVSGEGEAEYAAVVADAEVDVATDLVGSVSRSHHYDVRRSIPNPELPRLQSIVHASSIDVASAREHASHARRLYDRARAAAARDSENPALRGEAEHARRYASRADDKVEDKERDLRRARHALARAPALVVEVNHAHWPFVVETWRKRARIEAYVELDDLRDERALTPVRIDESVSSTDETIDHANPEIGLRHDPLELPSDARLADRLLDDAADATARALLQAVVRDQASRAEAAAARAGADGAVVEAVEAEVDAAVLIAAIDARTGQRRLDALRERVAD